MKIHIRYVKHATTNTFKSGWKAYKFCYCGETSRWRVFCQRDYPIYFIVESHDTSEMLIFGLWSFIRHPYQCSGILLRVNIRPSREWSACGRAYFFFGNIKILKKSSTFQFIWLNSNFCSIDLLPLQSILWQKTRLYGDMLLVEGQASAYKFSRFCAKSGKLCAVVWLWDCHI